MAYQNELAVGAAIARKAGELALKIHEGSLGIETKADESPVTIADRACEKLIVEELQREFPEDGLLGEEGAARESSNGRKWIIDPIDGTRDFIRGTGAWSVLIGLEEQGEVVAGFAYFPVTGQMFSAAQGEGAFHDGVRMKASAVQKKSDALLCCNGLSYMYRYAFSRGTDLLALRLLDRAQHGRLSRRHAGGRRERRRLDRSAGQAVGPRAAEDHRRGSRLRHLRLRRQ